MEYLFHYQAHPCIQPRPAGFFRPFFFFRLFHQTDGSRSWAQYPSIQFRLPPTSCCCLRFALTNPVSAPRCNPPELGRRPPELPGTDELTPLSQPLVPPRLAAMFHIPTEPGGTLLDVHRASAATVSRLCSSSGEGAEHASPSIRRMVSQKRRRRRRRGLGWLVGSRRRHQQQHQVTLPLLVVVPV
jgi:hypothetical protein